jgi:hypothetical protein
LAADFTVSKLLGTVFSIYIVYISKIFKNKTILYNKLIYLFLFRFTTRDVSPANDAPVPWTLSWSQWVQVSDLSRARRTKLFSPTDLFWFRWAIFVGIAGQNYFFPTGTASGRGGFR